MCALASAVFSYIFLLPGFSSFNKFCTENVVISMHMSALGAKGINA
jgi:hypothetical protein